ncbi:uncharacterized protein Z520_12056 [Fonsecaea multimorphosa CBS 102226]|uniref:F-box domain-containing protein n=1 Tax=Fonsecaea multimorphosa CBS 102226 TaxID=1442371 RepID=A0A0D2GS28_9EURO|nr:uncharacterized protein Z520_12056 [Fonsecaea multimorphosa CBS 102226]KIX92310.1 hypothetical protein Z520_12056 [Fonsecaea multimorphosa CBS 102226]OAL17680.1 hypothetical protein AYO22_11470 [Fonsecaea multimorphosa]
MAGYKEGQRLVLLDLPDEVLVEIVKYLPPPHNPEGCIEEEIYGNGVETFRATCRKAFHLCDPLWWKCLSVHTYGQYDRIRGFLSRDALRPLYVRHLELMPDYRFIREVDENLQDMAALTSLCPNLERLCIWPKSYLDDAGCKRLVKRWEAVLATHFQLANFSKLQYCYLRLWMFRPKLRQSLVMPLLRASRLVDLTLESTDLRGLWLDSIPMHSTALKKLKLLRCWVDEPTLAAILGAPQSLDSFEISLQFRHEAGPITGEEEYRLLLQGIELLTRLQPNLVSLGLTFQDGAGLEVEMLNDVFDFSPLRCLKELTLNALSTYFFRPLLQRLEAPSLWCPVNGLYKLPASLERINLLSETEDIDLAGLADALLRHRYAGKSLPTSLRLFCDVQKEHERPLTAAEQVTEDRSLAAIETLMTQLAFVEIKYLKRWFVHDEDRLNGNIYSCTRALEVKRTANAAIVDNSGLNSGSFEMKEDTYSELEFF